MAIATLNGFKIKKVDTSKDKVVVVFEGKSDEISTGVGKNLADSLKELNSAAYLSMSVSFSVDTAIITAPQTVEKKPIPEK